MNSLQARYNDPKAIVGEFDSMEELIEGAKANPRKEFWKGAYHTASWFGVDKDGLEKNPGVDAVADLLSRGWTRGANRIAEVMEGFSTIYTVPKAVRRVGKWSDQGDELDIQRVYTGNLDIAWRECKRAIRTGPQIVRLVCDSIESGGAAADTMFWRGAAVVILADKLQGAGYNVEVSSVWTGRHGPRVICQVIVKPATAPIDITTLASAVACPAFFRALGHSWGNGVDNHDGGYSVDRWIAAPGEILATHDRTWNKEVAHKWVEEQITLLNQAS